jgi:hypothetical protein
MNGEPVRFQVGTMLVGEQIGCLYRVECRQRAVPMLGQELRVLDLDGVLHGHP